MSHIVNEKGQPFAGTALHTVACAHSETTPPPQPLITVETLHALITEIACRDHSAFQRAQATCPDLLARPTFIMCRDEASTFFIHVFGCLEPHATRPAE